MDQEKIEKAKDALRAYFSDEIYICTRDHSAWSHGTMGLDDFQLARDDEGVIDDIVSDIVRALES